MKYVILILDGANDRPLKEIDGRTPLEVAHKPFIDKLARKSLVGTVRNVPKGFNPGSDIAIMSILGYDPKVYYTGRGPLEAANLGIELNDSQIAFRCNLVTVSEEGKMADYSAGHISSKEAGVLIKELNKRLGKNKFKFYSGVSYRNIMISERIGDELKTIPPHDIMGKNINEFLPQGKDAEIITDLMFESQKILEAHEVNKVRIDLGENPANMIWLWGQGRRAQIPSFKDKYGVDGFVISAVDLVNGLGKLLGLKVVKVPGATGYYDTNYEGKGKYAMANLKEYNFGFVHLEATDEAGHNGDLREKIKAIEAFDSYIIAPIYNYLKNSGEDFRILISSDHATPISLRTHSEEPVAFLCYGHGLPQEVKVNSFNERTARATLIEYDGPTLIEEVFFK